MTYEDVYGDMSAEQIAALESRKIDHDKPWPVLDFGQGPVDLEARRICNELIDADIPASRIEQMQVSGHSMVEIKAYFINEGMLEAD
jgi:hypothetical protein